MKKLSLDKDRGKGMTLHGIIPSLLTIPLHDERVQAQLDTLQRRIYTLRPGQQIVARLKLQGKSNAQIAKLVGYQTSRVEEVWQRILKRFDKQK